MKSLVLSKLCPQCCCHYFDAQSRTPRTAYPEIRADKPLARTPECLGLCGSGGVLDFRTPFWIGILRGLKECFGRRPGLSVDDDRRGVKVAQERKLSRPKEESDVITSDGSTGHGRRARCLVLSKSHSSFDIEQSNIRRLTLLMIHLISKEFLYYARDSRIQPVGIHGVLAAHAATDNEERHLSTARPCTSCQNP